MSSRNRSPRSPRQAPSLVHTDLSSTCRNINSSGLMENGWNALLHLRKLRSLAKLTLVTILHHSTCCFNRSQHLLILMISPLCSVRQNLFHSHPSLVAPAGQFKTSQGPPRRLLTEILSIAVLEGNRYDFRVTCGGTVRF